MPIRVINFNEISTNPKIYVSNHTIDVWLRYAMVKSTSCITIDFMNMSQLTERTFTPSESLSSLSLFLSLARGQCRPGKFWHRCSFRQKFLLRSLIMPRLSVEWMNELSHWPNLNVLLTRQPRLPVRLHRPYLAANLSRKQLLEALRYHYALLRGCMSAEEFSLYLNTPGLQLAKLEGKNGEQFTLELTMMISMDKEGDSTILFRNSEGIPLAEITFTLCEYQGKRTMFIGGLQGAKWEIPHQEIQNATKACHGLFPKRLVMEAACLFAQRLQVEQIIAVSNETHIYRSLRYRDKEGKIHADYNAFWESVGGVCDAERHYRLPAQIARKEIAEIASKKRAEYRRRYEMLDAIQPQMATMFRG